MHRTPPTHTYAHRWPVDRVNNYTQSLLANLLHVEIYRECIIIFSGFSTQFYCYTKPRSMLLTGLTGTKQLAHHPKQHRKLVYFGPVSLVKTNTLGATHAQSPPFTHTFFTSLQQALIFVSASQTTKLNRRKTATRSTSFKY